VSGVRFGVSSDRYPPIAAIQIGGALAFAACASGMGVRLSTPMLSSIRDKPQIGATLNPLLVGPLPLDLKCVTAGPAGHAVRCQKRLPGSPAGVFLWPTIVQVAMARFE
jgi:hypothetical protein